MRFDTPEGAGAQVMFLYHLKGILWQRFFSHKMNLMPPRGALWGGKRRISKDYLEKASAFDVGGRSS